ncbi:MAG: hypothetical protein ABI811_22500 [Acidobacteriota bacterium]
MPEGDWITSPVVIALAVVLLPIILIFVNRLIVPRLRRRRLRSRSRNWPLIKAHLDHACITEYRPSDTIITYRLDAWFTYTVDEKPFEGNYADDDMRLDHAKKLLSQLNHQPVMVHYNPSRPSEHYYTPKLKK